MFRSFCPLSALMMMAFAFGCAAGPSARGVSVGIHLATTQRSSGILQATDPDTGERLYVAEDPVVTEAGILEARAVPVEQVELDKSAGLRRVTRPGVVFHLSRGAARRLSRALADERRSVLLPDGTAYEEMPRLAILVNGRVFAVTAVKGRVRRRMLLVGNFTEEEAQSLAAALSGEAPPERRVDLAR